MEPHPDFKDLLKEFNARGVEYMIVGAYAVAAHGVVRATKDIDIWVRANAQNSTRVFTALANFGAPLSDISADDFASAGIFYTMGVEPVRVDILTDIPGVSFDVAWQNRVSTEYGDIAVFVLSKPDLINAKRAAGRHQDLADVEKLEELPD